MDNIKAKDNTSEWISTLSHLDQSGEQIAAAEIAKKSEEDRISEDHKMKEQWAKEDRTAKAEHERLSKRGNELRMLMKNQKSTLDNIKMEEVKVLIRCARGEADISVLREVRRRLKGAESRLRETEDLLDVLTWR